MCYFACSEGQSLDEERMTRGFKIPESSAILSESYKLVEYDSMTKLVVLCEVWFIVVEERGNGIGCG